MPIVFSRSTRLPYLLFVLLTAVAVAPLLLLSYYNHPFLDDYYNAANVRTTGLWAQQLDLYQHWTGRFSTSLLVTALNPLVYGWYDGFRWTPALTLLATLGVVYLGVRTLSRQLPRVLAALVAALFLLFYLQLIPDPYSAIYWFTGAMVYHVAGLAMLLAFTAAARAQQTSRPAARYAWQLIAAICTVATAAANELILIQLLLGIALALGMSWYHRKWPQVRWWSALLALALVAAVITVVAPGNYARMQFEGYSKDPNGSSLVLQMLKAIPRTPGAMVHVLIGRGRMLKFLLPLLLWVPAVLYWQRRGWLGTTLRLPWQLGVGFWLSGLTFSMWLLRGIMGPALPDRVVNGLFLFLLPASLLVIWAAVAYHAPRFTVRLPAWAWRWLPVVYLAVFSFVSLPRRAWQELLLSAPSFDQQLLAREEQMRSAWGQGVEHLVVKPIIGIKPRNVLIVDWDLTTDVWHYVNTETALYFQVKTIAVDKKLLPLAHPDFHYQ